MKPAAAAATQDTSVCGLHSTHGSLGVKCAAVAKDTSVCGLHSTHSSLRVKCAAVVWLAMGATLLGGCGTLLELLQFERDTIEPETTWQAHASELSRLRNWSLLGTLAVRSGGDASRVTMRWRQTRDSYLVRFMGPLGVGLFEIEGSATAVEARFPNGRRASAASPEVLLEQEIGWSVPLQGLRHWIVGAPAPDGTTPKMEIDDHGRLARLEQAGWTVIYERYGDFDDLALPERIRFSNASVDATVVVRRWKTERDPA